MSECDDNRRYDLAAIDQAHALAVADEEAADEERERLAAVEVLELLDQVLYLADPPAALRCPPTPNARRRRCSPKCRRSSPRS